MKIHIFELRLNFIFYFVVSEITSLERMEKNQILCLIGGVHRYSGQHLGRYSDRVLVEYRLSICRVSTNVQLTVHHYLSIDGWSLLGRQIANISPRDQQQIIDS